MAAARDHRRRRRCCRRGGGWGGAVGGAVAGACTGARLNVVACGAAGGATSNLVRTAISGTQSFSPGGLAIETVVAGATAGVSNLAINRIPALSGLRINPGWFRPTQVSNLWNPGPYVRRLSTSEGLGAAIGLVTGGLSSSAYGRLSANKC